MKTTTLIIIYNQFFPKRGSSYIECVHDSDSMSENLIDLKRKPRAARFNKVFETGEGAYNHWNAHKATRVYGHPLQRSE